MPEALAKVEAKNNQMKIKLIQEAKFDNQNELQIELQSRLNSGIYMLKIITENTIFTDKIILNR